MPAGTMHYHQHKNHCHQYLYRSNQVNLLIRQSFVNAMHHCHHHHHHHRHDYHDHLDQDGHQVNLLRAEASSEVDQPPTTPRINSSVCEEEFFDRVELFYISFYKHVSLEFIFQVESPFLPISSPREVGSPFQRWPRVHTGTSSLRSAFSSSISATIHHKHCNQQHSCNRQHNTVIITF